MRSFSPLAALGLLLGAVTLAQPALAQVREDADLAAEPRSIGFIGYQHDERAPHIWLQTNEPAKAHLTRAGRSTYHLHIEHAVLSRSVFSLPVDTSCFGGPVQSFVATAQEEPDTGVTIEITLQRPAHLVLAPRGRSWTLTALPKPSVHPQAKHKHRSD